MTVWTVGHSTRPIAALIALLRAHGIATVVDVRTAPRSRRHPQFDREALAESLPAAAIAYTHMPGLGGLRTPRRDSPNTGWREEGFRGYADYMQTDDFARHLERFTTLAGATRVAAMCAEAQPTGCHRWLLSDALVVRGVEVRHITSEAEPAPHVLTSWAHRDGARLTYPPRQGELPLDQGYTA
ncbi:MAG TPA: DUF488 domain-containing protein [Terriglobales bacterium]|nr:DUF488 domain-containing protein [Terriglobales bacterium]